MSDWGDTYYFIERQASTRKRMLAFCAVCRCTWEHAQLDCNRAAIIASEHYADGQITLEELRARWCQTQFEPVVYTSWMLAASGPLLKEVEFPQLSPQDDEDHQALAVFRQIEAESHSTWTAAWIACGLDVFGNVVKNPWFSPEWRTSTAVAIASQMYESRDFSAMPILADALQDAGCDNDDVLNHCRDEQQTHVRGCWVVDLVLGKE